YDIPTHSSMIRSKHFAGFVIGALKAIPVSSGIDSFSSEVREHFFGRHISGQVVFGHGATSKTLYSSVKASASGFISAINLFKPFVGSGVQMGTKFDGRVFRNQIRKKVIDDFRSRTPNRIR